MDTANRRDAEFWRNEAFEQAAQIAERYGATRAASDIRALQTQTKSQVFDFLEALDARFPSSGYAAGFSRMTGGINWPFLTGLARGRAEPKERGKRGTIWSERR